MLAWFRYAFLFIAGSIICTLPQFVFGQSNIAEKKISIEISNGTLVQILDLVNQKSGAHFSYNPRKLETARKISYTASDKKLQDILHDLSKEFNFSFELLEGQIVLKPEKKVQKVAPAVATFSGTISDANTGEALIGTSLYVKELKVGTITNAFGFYSLTIPKGKYNITVSSVGYQPFDAAIDLTTSLAQNITMEEAHSVLDAVVISSLTPTEVVTELRSSNVNLHAKMVEERPAFFGEMDVVKSLESVPGIKFHSDGSTFYYVRGGNRDQNMIMIDDAPIYNPSHFLGVFSTIVPDVVNDITVYKGDMPASLGGRLSSFLDIRTKKGNDQHTRLWGNTNIISTKLGVEGPIRKDASSYLLSARLSKVKWFFSRLDDQIKQFNFYDLTGKVNVKWTNKNRLYFSFYSGADHFERGNRGISWSNTAGTLRWNHLFTEKLFLNTTIAASGYDYFLHTDVLRDVKWNSHISNLNIKTDFSYFVRPDNELTFGLGLNGFAFNPGNVQAPNVPAFRTLSVRNAAEFVMYANHEWNITEKLGLNYGLRLSNWTNTGESFEFIFDENRNPVDTLYYKKGESYKEYTTIEPRLTLKYQLSERNSIKTSFSRNVQNIHLITNSVSPFTSLEVWLPSSYNIRPQKSNQITLGYYHHLNRWGASISAEAFHKRMFNQIEYNAHAETLLNPLLERELRFGTARAYGFEFLAKKDEGRVRGLAGYTYSRAKREFAEVNDGTIFNAFSDRPHQLNLMAAYDFSLRLNVGLNWIYSTGAPYTAPIGFFEYNGEEVPVYGQKNNARLPTYHRMDLSATLKLNKNPDNKISHSLSLSIFNIYGRKNPLFINYNKVETENDDLRVPENLVGSERVTSQLYLFRFAPSLSYTFKWL